MVLGSLDDSELEVTKQRIVVADEGEIDFNAFLHRRIGTALSDAIAVGFVGDLFANRRQVILAVGILHMGQEFAAFSRQVHTSAQQVAGGAHLGGVDIGLWEHATAEQHGDFMGVYLVVLGLAAVDRLHIEGMTEDKRDTVFGTEIGKPVPGKHTFSRQDDLIAVGRDGLEQRLGGSLHVAVQERFTGLVEDADVHGAGV